MLDNLIVYFPFIYSPAAYCSYSQTAKNWSYLINAIFFLEKSEKKAFSSLCPKGSFLQYGVLLICGGTLSIDPDSVVIITVPPL